MAKKAEAEDDSCVTPGYIYQLTTEPGVTQNFYTGIRFINQSDDDNCWEFFWDTNDGNSVLKELKNSTNRSQGVPLTSENLKIESIRFGINGANGCFGGLGCPDGAKQDDGVQPRATILIKAKIDNDPDSPSRIFQTTVSERNLNAE